MQTKLRQFVHSFDSCISLAVALPALTQSACIFAFCLTSSRQSWLAQSNPRIPLSNLLSSVDQSAFWAIYATWNIHQIRVFSFSFLTRSTLNSGPWWWYAEREFILFSLFEQFSVNQSNRQHWLEKFSSDYRFTMLYIFSTRIWGTVNIVTWHDLFDPRQPNPCSKLSLSPNLNPGNKTQPQTGLASSLLAHRMMIGNKLMACAVTSVRQGQGWSGQAGCESAKSNSWWIWVAGYESSCSTV